MELLTSLDFIITRCRDKMDIHSTRAMSGANCWTDHQMLRSKVAFRIRKNHNRQTTSKPTKLNTAKLSIISHLPMADSTPGGDGIPAEVWKHGGDNLFSRLHQLITNVWEVGSVPKAWKDASIVTIYKKGDRTDCGNF